MAVTVWPIVTPRTWPTLEAGSVLTSRTRLPCRARCSAVAQATEVLPTPPLPVKNTNLGGSYRNVIAVIAQQHPDEPEHSPDCAEMARVAMPSGTTSAEVSDARPA